MILNPFDICVACGHTLAQHQNIAGDLRTCRLCFCEKFKGKN